MKHIHICMAITLALLAGNNVSAYEVVQEFSAEAIQKAPARPDYRAHMYVSKDAVRTDSVINNIPVSEIINSKSRTRLLLVPKDKVYLQQKASAKTGNTKQTKSGKPCDGMTNTTCKSLGKESINNRQTEKWEFVVNRNGQVYRSLHWIDVKRNMPVREFYPDGTVTELIIKGKEKVNGRATEKWLMQTTRADGQQISSTQWYDPELKMSIREEMPGGFVRELKNIKTGKQDRNLFAVPKGYKKVEQLPDYLMPQQPAVRPGM